MAKQFCCGGGRQRQTREDNYWSLDDFDELGEPLSINFRKLFLVSIVRSRQHSCADSSLARSLSWTARSSILLILHHFTHGNMTWNASVRFGTAANGGNTAYGNAI